MFLDLQGILKEQKEAFELQKEANLDVAQLEQNAQPGGETGQIAGRCKKRQA